MWLLCFSSLVLQDKTLMFQIQPLQREGTGRFPHTFVLQASDLSALPSTKMWNTEGIPWLPTEMNCFRFSYPLPCLNCKLFEDNRRFSLRRMSSDILHQVDWWSYFSLLFLEAWNKTFGFPQTKLLNNLLQPTPTNHLRHTAAAPL